VATCGETLIDKSNFLFTSNAAESIFKVTILISSLQWVMALRRSTEYKVTRLNKYTKKIFFNGGNTGFDTKLYDTVQRDLQYLRLHFNKS